MTANVKYYNTVSNADQDDGMTGYLGVVASLSVGYGQFGNYSTYWYVSYRSDGLSRGFFHNGDSLIGTGDNDNYILGPAAVSYYSTQPDTLTDTNGIFYDPSYIVGTHGGYTNWKISTNSTGTSLSASVYSTGNALNPDGLYYLYPSAPCFLEGTTVLCKVDDIETYIPVEQLKPGTLVKTSLNGYKPIVLVGKESIQNPGHDERIEERLYKLTPSKYPQLKDDLYLTGGHSVLEFPLTEKQTQDTFKKLGDLYVTEKKYRLLACLDERAEPWASEGTYTIWAFALQHDDVGKNYGVYVNGGLLVESCSEHFLKINSNMELIAA